VQKDLIISAVSEYNYDKLKYWVNSINRSGFTGKKVVIAFNIADDTIKHLNDNDFEVVLVSNQRDITNDGYYVGQEIGFRVPALRHYFYWKYLSTLSPDDIRFVISTDISDVVFQTNPSDWLDDQEYDCPDLIYGSEGLKYKDEDWGRENLLNCFGQDIYDKLKDTSIYNAGSMAGLLEPFRDFSLKVHFAQASAPHNPTPDQAAVNVMLSLEPYKSTTLFCDHDSNWACELGTTADPTKMHKFRPNLLCPEPTFDGDFVYNSKGEKYVIVHQYNRVPEWKNKIEKKYE